MTNPVINGAVLAVLQALGLAVLEAVLAFLANAANLQGLVNPQMAALVAAVALALENSIYNSTGKSLLGTVNL